MEGRKDIVVIRNMMLGIHPMPIKMARFGK